MGSKLRAALGVAAVVAMLLVASQIVIPLIFEAAVEDRLTEEGGSAEASISAFPAFRLLFDDGDRVEVDASGVSLEVGSGRDDDVLDRLDGFSDVDVRLEDAELGPLDLDEVTLTRKGSDGYRLRAEGDTSPGDLVAFGADRLGLPGGAIAAIAFGGQQFSIDLDMELVENDGRAEVVSGGGKIAGIPTGPLGALIAEEVIARL